MGLTVDVHLCPHDVSNDTTVSAHRGNTKVSISPSNGREWC